jgi:hypothetical protein
MGIFSRLSPDVIDIILSHMSIPTLIRLAETARDCRHVVHFHIKGRLACLISPFFSDVDNFLSILTKTKSVISGSQALFFMMPTCHWIPNDMDVYTNETHYWRLLNYFEDECGYERVEGKSGSIRVVEEGEEENIGKYNSTGGIAYVMSLKKGDRKVDVILSEQQASIYPLFFFHTTLVQNFISGKGFFSAYPTLTGMNRAIINPISFWPQLEPTEKTSLCLTKYSTRGFDIRTHLSDWSDNPEHICHYSKICPHTIRCTADSGCMFVPFADSSLVVGGGDRRSRTYTRSEGVVWNLGGNSCNETYDTMKPFVICAGQRQ